MDYFFAFCYNRNQTLFIALINMPSPKDTAASSTTGNSFIAVNILPPHQKAGVADATPVLQERIARAQAMGFTHAWLNPISAVAPTICERICLDTGTTVALHNSLYAPEEPQRIRADFPIAKLREINKTAKKNGFSVLADFVWKHVSENSSLLAKKPTWFGKKVKDIVEYKFTDSAGKLTAPGKEIIEYLKSAIDFLLDFQNGCGFAGIRIDAASHLTPEVRTALYSFAREKFPEAIIFEEVLFDRAQEERISRLVAEAQSSGVYSNFVTCNAYYQSPDVFGALPSPEKMGDKTKLELAEGRGISFTGNHDHFSIGWGVVLCMAWRALKSDEEFLERIREVKTTPSGSKSEHLQNALEALLVRSEVNPRASFAENLDASNQGIIRYLIPYANEIARILLDKSAPAHQKLFEEFQLQLFEKIYNRTLASISGYFFLDSELDSPFQTPRIFSNQHGEPLSLLLLTVGDLKANMPLTDRLLKNMAGTYTNFTNFIKAFPALKKARMPGYVGKEKDCPLEHDLKLCLPYLIDYLRNHPAENEYTIYKDSQIAKAEQRLMQDLALEPMISGINKIYANLTTPGCSHYHTFNSLEKFKIIVRYNEHVTDLIVLNLNLEKRLLLTDIDLEKIALWFQSRLYPQEIACRRSVALSSPFTEAPSISPPHGYMDYWLGQVGHAFNFSYNQIIGTEPGHTTYLYLGTNISTDFQRYRPILRVHLKTELEKAYELFEDRTSHEMQAPPLLSSKHGKNAAQIGVGSMGHSTIFCPKAIQATQTINDLEPTISYSCTQDIIGD